MLTMPSRRIPTTVTEMLEPSTTAVVMWDFQVGLGGRSTRLDSIVAAATRLLDGADEAGVAVIWSRHTVPPLDQVTPGSMYRMMKKQGATDPSEVAPFMQEGSPEREFIPQLQPRSHDTIIEKSAPSFFVGTPLEMRLGSLGVSSLVFCGVATDIGIDLTAKHAFALGYFPVVVEDAVGSYSDDRHEAAITSMRSWIPVTNSASILEIWAR